jgi:brefeldin A-resistance guanine nucleotide exchange factor 1
VGLDLGPHDTKSLLKCVESLSFIVRDAAHITPDNFELCVKTLRIFVEASLNGGRSPDEGAVGGVAMWLYGGEVEKGRTFLPVAVEM